jgi:hypothetical protein
MSGMPGKGNIKRRSGLNLAPSAGTLHLSCTGAAQSLQVLASRLNP